MSYVTYIMSYVTYYNGVDDLGWGGFRYDYILSHPVLL